MRNPDVSRSKIDNSASPLRDDIKGSRMSGNEDVRISGVQSRDGDARRGSLDKNKSTPPKAVKFAQGGDAAKAREASPDFSKQVPGPSTTSFGTGSLKPQSQAQPVTQLQTKPEPAVVIKDMGVQNKGGVQKLNLGKIGNPQPATTTTNAVTKQPAASKPDAFKTDDLDFEDLDDYDF